MGVEGFRSSEGSLMHFQIFIGCKTVVSVVTVEGSFIWVLSCTFKSSLDAKAPLQSWQLKGFFEFASFMLFQIFTGQKSFIAVVAVEKFLSSVGSLMHFQIFITRQCFFLLVTVTGFISSVGSFMHFEILTGCKSSSAVVAERVSLKY